MEKIIYQYKSIDINFFLILLKNLLQTILIKPNLKRMLNNITNIYKYLLNIQNINTKNLFVLLLNQSYKNNQYLFLNRIIQQLIKNKIK
jgi:hypothetical protein